MSEREEERRVGVSGFNFKCNGLTESNFYMNYRNVLYVQKFELIDKLKSIIESIVNDEMTFLVVSTSEKTSLMLMINRFERFNDEILRSSYTRITITSVDIILNIILNIIKSSQPSPAIDRILKDVVSDTELLIKDANNYKIEIMSSKEIGDVRLIDGNLRN
jgi:hypothetical protein